MTSLFEESFQPPHPAESCILVIFGASGDLTHRKLVPALYNLYREGMLSTHFACVGFARREKSDDSFRDELETATAQYSRTKPIDNEVWSSFKEHLFYHQSEFHDDEGYINLKKKLDELDAKLKTGGNRLYYLSTPPSFFPQIVEKLSKHGLIHRDNPSRFSRVIVEKPFGHDLNTAEELQRSLLNHLKEDQIFRIDHYLGKETVQNLLVFRFTNPIFETLWNAKHIEQVQITVAEELGIGTRGKFWEEAGMLRDIIQNHMMQLLSLVAMEQPQSFSAEAIGREKVAVLKSCKPMSVKEGDLSAVRGQYGPGYIQGNPVIGYRQENNVDPNSNVETYAALKLFIDNPRWAKVPFFLRAGKRLPKRTTEIAILFRKVDHPLFPLLAQDRSGQNVLVIRIQPNEGISLKINCKIPSQSQLLQPVKMDFRYGSFFGHAPPEAYERLICDAMAGDKTLFLSDQEVFASWKLLTPVLEHWQETKESHFPNYTSGSFGPKAADLLLAKEGFAWRPI